MRERQPLPQAIRDAPELDVGLDMYYQAFADLSSCRPIGFGEGRIPWTAVEQYADSLGLQGDQREDLHHHMTEMDMVYLEWSAKKTKEDAKRKGRR